MGRSTAMPAAAAARAAAAAGITAGSFLVLRYAYHGDCMIPTYYSSSSSYYAFRAYLFAALSVAFIIGFVWLMSELAYPLILKLGVRGVPARLLPVLAGVAGYAAVGVAGWLLAPEVPPYQDLSKGWYWSFWHIAILLMSGNFSDFGCGY